MSHTYTQSTDVTIKKSLSQNNSGNSGKYYHSAIEIDFQNTYNTV